MIAYIGSSVIAIIAMTALHAVIEGEITIAQGFLLSVLMICLAGAIIALNRHDPSPFVMYSALIASGVYGSIFAMRRWKRK